MREGRSFSGRERHCAFLNLGDGTFCDASSTTGFDLPDDGRALALVDWDGDGALDIWLANRNGPQVRFLRNRCGLKNNFLAFRLTGTSSNRDAIGSRVRVFLRSDPTRPLTRSLRAGSGFLSQDSKWLHFGLGEEREIERVVVHWPSGTSQMLQIPEVNQRYLIVEGDDRVQVHAVETNRTASKREASVSSLLPRLASPTAETTQSALCFSMVHLPAQTYEDLEGREQTLLVPGVRSVLVNLWADWCHPCVEELAAFSREEARLRQQGIDILALSVDAAMPTPRSSAAAERKLLGKIAYPFRAGKADRAMLEKLQLLHDTLFELRSPLPIPTSLLVDRRGRVTAVYKGPVSVEQLLTDKQRLAARTTEQWRMATMIFPGRWLMPPRRRHLFDFVSQLAERGYYEDCLRYVGWNQKMLMSHPSWPLLEERLQQIQP